MPISVIHYITKMTEEKDGVLRVSVADENFIEIKLKNVAVDKDWYYFRLDEKGGGELVTSKPHLLFGLFCRIEEEWINEPVSKFSKG